MSQHNTPIGQEQFQITEVCIRAIKPFKLASPFQDSTMGPFHSFSVAMLGLRDADGTYAEVPTFLSLVPSMERTLFTKLFSTKPRPYSELYEDLYWSIRNEGFRGHSCTALGQLDMALHCIAAQRHDLPLYRYLGGKTDRIPVYASGGSLVFSEKQAIDEVESFLKDGFEVIKIKIGHERGRDFKKDVSRVREIRRQLGADFALAVDGNQVWTPNEAIAMAEELAPYDIAWFEEPIHSADLVGIEQVCQSAPMPVSFGESEKTDKVFPSLVKAGVSHLQPIAGYLASVSEWQNVRSLARQKGISFSSGGFSQMTCQLMNDEAGKEYTENLMVMNQGLEAFYSLSPELKDGHFHLHDVPGSCLRMDWEELASRDLVAAKHVWKSEDYAHAAPVVN